jgi:hypothetical protein
MFWHRVCCEDCTGVCGECPETITVDWTGSIEFEAFCWCEDLEFECTSLYCGRASIALTVIGPLTFTLRGKPGGPFGNDQCVWTETQCFELQPEVCTNCCPDYCECPPSIASIHVCITLQLYCVGGVWTAVLSFGWNNTSPGPDGNLVIATVSEVAPCSECPPLGCDEVWTFPSPTGAQYSPCAFTGDENLTSPPPYVYDLGTLVWRYGC